MAKADPQAAFRAGLSGEPYFQLGRDPAEGDRLGPGLAEAAASFAFGPNEEVVLATRRLPGLSEPQAAFEVGRLLRAVARLFDRARAPAMVGLQFRDNLAAAVITNAMRRPARPWGVEDAVDMFMEMYARVLSEDGGGFALVRKALVDNARDHDGPLLGERAPPSPPRRAGAPAWSGPASSEKAGPG